jgi:phosphatidylinositol glycan class A protein
MREIFLREKITLVHGHSAFSTLCHESIFHACNMGLKVHVPAICNFVDCIYRSLVVWILGCEQHSHKQTSTLFSWMHRCSYLCFDGWVSSIKSSILCVIGSRTNTMMRSGISPSLVHVIPNALDTAMFVPAECPPPLPITIVVVSRYRLATNMEFSFFCTRPPFQAPLLLSFRILS